ncbi:MAG: Glyceraldehyde-3-phosphate dehydrogenase [bacterium]|nr:Glyceraldehyde-3-phosphate dehydrogenase [bacterium]
MRVFVNGMGRIGRLALRQLAFHPGVDIVGVNDLSDYEQILHLIRYDSNYGTFPDISGTRDSHTQIGRHQVRHFVARNILDLPLGELGIDLVLECTGAFNSRDKVEPYLQAGARRVLISAPAKGVDFSMVPGINHEGFRPDQHFLVSAASCTTNCAVPVMAALDSAFGVEAGNLTTVHAYTNDQMILDRRHSKDWRRARNAATNIIPTSSGAGKAVAEILPHLAGKLHATALRVPVQTCSALDCTIRLREPVESPSQINDAFRDKAHGTWQSFFELNEDPIVSSDVRGSDKAAVVDALSTSIIDPHLVYCLAWYDNEWGYTAQLIRALEHIQRVEQALSSSAPAAAS